MTKKAFTLAEVLITLGIIGVVAALVMPSLIANYKKKVYVAQLQKAVSTWDNAMKLMLATDGVEYINDTEFAKAVLDQNPDAECSQNSLQQCSNAFNILKKYLKISEVSHKDYNFTYLNGRNAWTFGAYTATPDGMVYDFDFQRLNNPVSELLSEVMSNGTVNIDINGPKGPNIMGRDIFAFIFDVKGNLVPMGSNQDVELFEGGYWKDAPSSYCGEPGSSDASMAYGWGCAARIIENGWVMDY